MASDSLKTDEMIGTYRIVRKAGEGGMGEVYEAWDANLNRRVAIKIVSAAASQDADLLERFRGEARVLARLNHPNVVALYAQGAHKGRSYMVMEYADGMTVDEFLIHHPCSVVALVDLFRQALEGLAAAHQESIIHRDLKPQNIIIGDDLVLKIVDFGVAKDHADYSSHQTTTNMVVGTANYLAPESVAGKLASAQTDIFSLGLVFYYMVTGEVPFQGRGNLEVLEKIRTHDLVLPSKTSLLLPEALRTVITRMTRRNPMARYRTAKEALAELDAVDLNELPAEFCVAPSPRILLANAAEIRRHCRQEKFNELETRLIVNLALEHHHQLKEKSDATDVINVAPVVILSETSLYEGMRRFRMARSAIIARRTLSEPVYVQPPARRLSGLLPALVVSGTFVGVIFYFVPKSSTKPAPPAARAVAGQTVAPAETVSPPSIAPATVEEQVVEVDNKPGVPLPNIKIGTSFKIRSRAFRQNKFLENTIREWTLREVDGLEYIWEADDGSVRHASQQNMSPPFFSYLDSEELETGKEVTNKFSGDPRALFPLKVGSQVQYQVIASEKNEKKIPGREPINSVFVNTCLATAKERIKVEAGEFDTIRVECSPDRMPHPIEIFNYSPKLQHWVRRETIQNTGAPERDKKFVRELIGFALPLNR